LSFLQPWCGTPTSSVGWNFSSNGHVHLPHRASPFYFLALLSPGWARTFFLSLVVLRSLGSAPKFLPPLVGTDPNLRRAPCSCFSFRSLPRQRSLFTLPRGTLASSAQVAPSLAVCFFRIRHITPRLARQLRFLSVARAQFATLSFTQPFASLSWPRYFSTLFMGARVRSPRVVAAQLYLRPGRRLIFLCVNRDAPVPSHNFFLPQRPVQFPFFFYPLQEALVPTVVLKNLFFIFYLF